MRYILVIFFTIGLTLNSFSQLKLSTIMNLIKMDFNKFEDFTIKNGWSFHSIKNTKELNGLCYVRKSSNDKEFLTLYTKYFNEDKHLTYQLHNQNSYLNLKNQIKLNGFKFLNSEMRSNSIKYNYRKVMNDYLSYEISIYQIQPDIKNKIYGSWEINISQIIDMSDFILDTTEIN